MILADTSVWIDHLRSGDETLRHLRASTFLGSPIKIWTRDKRLAELAAKLKKACQG